MRLHAIALPRGVEQILKALSMTRDGPAITAILYKSEEGVQKTLRRTHAAATTLARAAQLCFLNPGKISSLVRRSFVPSPSEEI